MSSAEQIDVAPTKRRRSRLHLVYFALAAFDIATISATLLMTHAITTQYQVTVAVHKQWSERLRNIVDLQQLAQRMDAPGNDVFASREIQDEVLRRDEALRQFNQTWGAIVLELERNTTRAERAEIMSDLFEVRRYMDGMVPASDRIFREMQRGQIARAAAEMAEMDRTYGHLTSSIADVVSRVEAIHDASLERQLRVAQSVRQLEVLVSITILLIVIGVAIYGHRISEEFRRSEERDRELVETLRAAQANLEHYADNVAHELRGPISKVRVGAELALSRDRTSEEYQEALLSTVEEAENLTHIVEGLLFLARASAQKMPLVLQQVQLHRELDLVRDYYDAVASQAGVRLTLEADTLVTVAVDRVLLQRLVSNLVSNAIAHTPDGGEVRITAAVEEGALRVAVADTGEGVPPEAQAHVFDRFFRSDKVRSTEQKRLGLGLPIARSIVELHGGEIRLESAPGKGATVTAIFPQSLAPHAVR